MPEVARRRTMPSHCKAVLTQRKRGKALVSGREALAHQSSGLRGGRSSPLTMTRSRMTLTVGTSSKSGCTTAIVTTLETIAAALQHEEQTLHLPECLLWFCEALSQCGLTCSVPACGWQSGAPPATTAASSVT